MKVIADLHLHSRFSRAVSSKMVVPTISDWAKKKGIDLVATGDFTHPVWFRELKVNLKEAQEGLYKVKGDKGALRFLLSTEISCIYSKAGKTRRIHILVFAPSFRAVEIISKELSKRGAKLMSDGRPIVGLSARDVAEIVFEADERCLVIPAHAWTPWYSLYGSKSGFNSILECFEDLSGSIYAIETGLSSDPAANWRIKELETRQIVSFSDAHSPQKLGREATIFDLEDLSYEGIRKAIVGGEEEKINHTIEFYPEEGKYHYSGHRKCSVIHSPKETKKMGSTCPVCGKSLTVGVMHRVEILSSSDIETESEKDKFGVRWIKDKEGKRPPYVMLVPLLEILSEAHGVGVNTKTAMTSYEQLINTLGSEFEILSKIPIEDIEKLVGGKIGEAIKKVRSGDIMVKPGYDGVFGEVKIWREDEAGKEEDAIDQRMLF